MVARVVEPNQSLNVFKNYGLEELLPPLVHTAMKTADYGYVYGKGTPPRFFNLASVFGLI